MYAPGSQGLSYWFSSGSSVPRTASGSIIIFSMDIEKEIKEGGIEKGKVEALVLCYVALQSLKSFHMFYLV